jgi:hypothetical protein
MKRSIFILALAVATAILGCQDANSPVASDESTLRNAAKPRPAENIALFDEMVSYTDIGVATDLFQAVGEARYTINQSPILSDELYDVEVSTNGELRQASLDAPGAEFAGYSANRIRIAGGKKASFEKQFVASGMKPATVVNVRFTVSDEKSLAVSKIWLTAAEKSPKPVAKD